MKKNLLIAFIFLTTFKVAMAQTDKEFWFVAPEISLTHEDRPIYLRISTLGSAATVTIDQPANSSFTPIVLNIAANTTLSRDLTLSINDIENGVTPNIIENKGLHIVSTADINIYYEVLGSQNGKVLNSDIFTLKGRNALGKMFYTPFQNQLDNANSNIKGASSIDIVATEDNTTITITPTQAVVGHAAGTPFKIKLNKGQTYSAKAVGITGALHLSGTVVTSDKPIAVTVKDDSIVQGSAIDLAGDQIVPTDIIGKEYIVVKGQLNGNGTALGDRAVIVATVNGTVVTTPNGTKTLNAGETYNYQVTAGAEYITSDKPIYVFHLSGFGDEVGGALLPPVKCTGSRQVAVTRDTDEHFFLNILVKDGGQGSFTLNGDATLITADKFFAVPGTSNGWYYASIEYNTTQVPPGSNNVIANSSKEFHLAVINGEATGAGCRYGYFSNYGSAAITPIPDAIICNGQSKSLSIGSILTNILWSTGEKTSSITVSPNKTTEYSVSGEYGECVVKDTVLVTVKYPVTVTKNPLTPVICEKEGAFFESAGAGSDSTFHWEVSANGGTTFTPVADGNIYSGSTTTKLTLKDVPLTMNKYVYRMANKGYCNTAYSNNAVLTVQDCDVQTFDIITPGTVDGKNDLFVIKGNEPGYSKIEIYNRWGRIVYKSDDYRNDWDAKDESEGVYYFIYHTEKKNGEIKIDRHGYVQVIK